MFTWFRAGLFAALLVFVTTPSPAAEKAFQDAALDDAAITLEADLKDEAGTVAKPPAKLKQEAEALLKSQDLAGAAVSTVSASSETASTSGPSGSETSSAARTRGSSPRATSSSQFSWP
jgi:hypothetical protein